MRRLLLFGALLLLSATVCVAELLFDRTETAQLSISTAVDTAQDIKFTPGFGIDSFTYGCTLQVISGTDTVNDTVEWTAPLYVFRVDPVATDTGYTYACSVAFAADTLGFTYAIPETTFGTTDSMIAMLVDEFVDSFNNVADLKDSVTAADGGSYLTLTSKYGQETFTERWVFDGLNVSDSLDTAAVTITTVAMVCDSMVAAMNASALSDYLTAYDSTTFWHFIADDQGLPITQVIGDTTTDSAQTQANVTGWSTTTDTLILSRLITDSWKAEGARVRIIFAPSTDTTNGIGDADSVTVVYATKGWGVSYDTLASATTEGLPCTLLYTVTEDSTGIDTVLKVQSALMYTIRDSCSDVARLVDYIVTVQEMVW